MNTTIQPQTAPVDSLSFSIIIPTYNRSSELKRLLGCLDVQTYPYHLWNVIIVDDGSNDSGYEALKRSNFNFARMFLQQNHQGAADARNFGAKYSQADVLLFLDDDVIVEPEYLSGLARAHSAYEHALIMGTFRSVDTESSGPFKRAVLRTGVTQGEQRSELEVDFTLCVSHNLSIKRREFYEIGEFQDPTNKQGWPNWDDIDLGYRAHLRGYTFIQVPDACGSHLDHVLEDFQIYCERIFRAGKSANWLFKKFPELVDLLPMFKDKTPIRLGQDSFFLIVRKIARLILSWKPILSLMERFTHYLEYSKPGSQVLIYLYRWISSTYIFLGYRSGSVIIPKG